MDVWETWTFSDLLAEPVRNGIYKKKEFHGRGQKMINMGELFSYDFISNQEMKRVELFDRELGNSIVKDGDLLFARRSLVFEGSGKCSLVVQPSEDTTFESSVIRVRPNLDWADPRFYYYLFRSPQGRALMSSIATGTAVFGIRGSELALLRVPKPPLPTQRKIANILSAYDELIEINQQRIALLERAGREMYREWFVRLRFPGHERTKIANGVPEGWESKTYSDVFKFLGGFAFKSKTYQPEGRFGIVTIKNVHNARFIPECASRLDAVPEKMKEHCVLATGDILLSLTGDVGRCCMVFGESYLLNQRVAKVVGSTDIPKSFAYWTFSNEPTRRKLENLAHGAAQSNLSPVTLGNREFIKPESIVLDLFGKIADPIFWQITTLNLVIVQLNRARDLLLPRLMSGKLTV